MSQHVIEEAKRCLHCPKPGCQVGCPIHTPIREAIQLLLDGKIEEAGKLLFENNPLSIVCCRVCPQENQCEGHCALGKKGNPVQISSIEQYISDYYLNTYKPNVKGKRRAKVAIIGAGPAGITIAFILSSRNYDVTIYEGNDQIGGVLRYGIPDFRLPKEILNQLMNILIESGVKIRPNTTIGTQLSIDDLFRDGFKAIFMGTGVWRPYKLNIKGESLGNVHYAINYLHNPNAYQIGRSLAVIGAGNVAMDVARTAFRHGCEKVYIICRKDADSVTARDTEVQYAKVDGAKFIFYKIASEIVEEGIILEDSEVYMDDIGKKHAKPIEGTKEFFPVDSVIISIGQGPKSTIVSSTTGIEIEGNGLVTVDEYGRTSRKGVFAGGDVVTGAKTVVEAVKVSRKVADAIDQFISDTNTGNVATT